MIYKKILSDNQLKLIEKIKDLPRQYYMAGGTALALQLGHRTSLDFDFFTNEHFEIEKVLANLERNFDEIKVERTAKDTLILEIDGVSFSLFYYPYGLIRPLVDFENIKLASLEDIAAMKMIAISTRGKRRDFIDAFYLLEKFNLGEIIKMTLRKYPSYQVMVILKGLIYFKDAEADEVSRKIEIFDTNFSWEAVKKKITEEVGKYQAKMISA